MDGIYQHYIIDMSSNNNFVQVPTVQGDGNGVRGFEVELIQNGVPYQIDADDVIISIMGTKPDTNGIFNECSLTKEGYILVDITSQMSAVKGRGDYEIVLMSRSKNSQLKSFPFFIITTPSALDINYLVSSDEFQLLTRRIFECEEAIEEMQELEETVTANENERISNENTRQRNEQTRQNNENTRQSNESQRQKNEQERQSNEDIRKENENQRIVNENLRNEAENVREANELTRQYNESNRESNENERIANELERKNSEDIRKGNEDVRQDKEETRQKNELIRQQNEKSRNDAELERQNNETNRQNVEIERQETFESLEQSMNEGLDKLDVTNETAKYYAELAESYAHGDTGIREDEDTDNAKEYARQAKESAEKAAEIAGGDFVLQSEKGSPNGVAVLDETGRVPLEQIPDFEIISATEPTDQEIGYWLLDYE